MLLEFMNYPTLTRIYETVVRVSDRYGTFQVVSYSHAINCSRVHPTTIGVTVLSRRTRYHAVAMVGWSITVPTPTFRTRTVVSSPFCPLSVCCELRHCPGTCR